MFNWKDYIAKNWMGVHLSRTEAEILFILHVRATEFVPIGEIIGFVYPNPDLEPDHANGL